MVYVLDMKELEARVWYSIICIKCIVFFCFESGIATDGICNHLILPQSASFTIAEI